MNNDSNIVSDSSLNRLEYDDALDIMQNYGYSSASIHPYIYQNGDDLGICYSYVDADYGTLERIKLFESAKELDDYLKQMKWLETNGPLYHIRMALDNYETVYPRILFLRNDRIMVPSEMEDIETYDYNLSKRENLDDTTKILYEAGDLLLVYDELKARQLAYIQNLTVLKNTLRRKYYELQLEVDKYNRIGKIERHLSTVPDITDTGIDITLEISIKDKYNQLIAQKPTFEEAVQLLKEAWEMCKVLELNSKYYEVQIEDNNIRNEIKLVEAKLDFMKELNDDVRPLFRIDLVGKFRKINKEFLGKNNEISNEYINSQLLLVEKKYSVFDQLDLYDVSEYLKEGISNSNYDDLKTKYAKGRVKSKEVVVRLPLNEVASNLTVQFKELTQQEQAVLVLHNNAGFKKIFDAILNTPDFESLPTSKLMKSIKKIDGFSKVKTECFDMLKKRLEDPVNANIKASLFSTIDFSSFDNYISSIVKMLTSLKTINGRLVLNSDVNMYSVVKNPEDLKNNRYTSLTNDINSMYVYAQNTKSMIALVQIKEGTPVLYAPYTFDLGDLYTKNASPQVFIKETIGFDLLVDNSSLNIQISDNKVNVVNYQSEKEISQNLTTATSLNTVYKTTFCKLVFRSNAVKEEVVQEVAPVSAESVMVPPVVPVVEDKPVEQPVAPIEEKPVQPVEPPVKPVQPKTEEKPKGKEFVDYRTANSLFSSVNLPDALKKEEEKKEEKVEEKPVEKKEEIKEEQPKVEEKKPEVPIKEEPKIEDKKPEDVKKPEVKEEEKKEEVKVEEKRPQQPIQQNKPQQPQPKPEDKKEEPKPVQVNKPEQPKVEEKKEEVKPVQQPAKPVVPQKPELPKVEEKKEEAKVENKPTPVKPEEKKPELPKVEDKKEVVKPQQPQQQNKPQQPQQSKPVQPQQQNKPQQPVQPNKPVEQKKVELPKVEEKKAEPVKPVLPQTKQEVNKKEETNNEGNV